MKVLIFTSEAELEDQALMGLCSELAGRLVNYQILRVDVSPQPPDVAIYDIVATPAVVVAQDDESTQQIWQQHFEAIDELSLAFGYV